MSNVTFDIGTKLFDKALAKCIEERYGITMERMGELAAAEKDGHCIVLKCKKGDTLYMLERWCNGERGDCGYSGTCDECPDHQYEVSAIEIRSDGQAFACSEEIGKTAFFSHEEAEAAKLDLQKDK